MIAFPNCKINLGLRVLDKRSDGFHNIETILYPVKWFDVLECMEANAFSFEAHGLNIGDQESGNLCVKAFRIIENEFMISPVKMCLLKNIPIGAGLGGGSSDAAFTLIMLNEMFRLNLSSDRLKAFAARLGSDCSFFIDNMTVLASGKGDQLEPLKLDLSAYYILIACPGIPVSTAWAYAELDRERSLRLPDKKMLKEIITLPLQRWQDELKNDFEEIIFLRHPELAFIKEDMYRHGALYASMSGSGSAVYGIFSEEPPATLCAAHQCLRGYIGAALTKT